jgi:signal transduction histidine kinase
MGSALSSYSPERSIMDAVAHGIAHDLNDMLTTIIGYTDLSLRRVGPENPIRHNLEETKRAAERAACLVRQLQINSSSKSRPA